MNMTEDDQKRIDYKQTLRGLVDAMHGLVEAFEASSIAAKAYDHDGINVDPDPAQHAALTSCRAIMNAILQRHAGAAQILGLDHLAPKPARAATSENDSLVGETYSALANAARATGDEQAIDQLRRAVNVDPSLAALIAMAMRRSAIPGMGVANEMIPV
jgi:hypothetical protein